uniref:Uncharacterized protein n=1 Tax=Rhizophora mucronata TaxID=61149 RepID=A0A2P2QRR2_RHIMU
MAEYNYTYRGYYTPNAPRTDGWSNTSYDRDHVCRPVIIDAEGRKRPIVSYSPFESRESCITRTEAVQYVPSPVTSHTRYDPRFSRPDSLGNYGVVEDQWHQRRSPVWDRPLAVDDFITKVQSESSRPKFGPLSASHWRQTPTTTDNYGNSGRYSENNDWSNNEWQRHKGSRYRNENSDDYFHNHGNMMEPTMTTSRVQVRPSHSTLDTTPAGFLSKPTSDINKAMQYLEEAANPHADFIGGKSSASRYGNFKFKTRR